MLYCAAPAKYEPATVAPPMPYHPPYQPLQKGINCADAVLVAAKIKMTESKIVFIINNI
jgi:hypothetical protein